MDRVLRRVETVTQGFHTGVLVDQAGTGAVTLTDGLGLVACGASGTAGFMQGIGVAAATPLTVIAEALLPSSGIGSSITAAALAQASQTATIGGTPAAGDTLTVTIQTPYISASPGTAQTTSWTTPGLTTAQAVSTTTAATALAAYLNTQPSFTAWFVATSSTNVVTVTVVAATFPGNPMLWNVNFVGPGIGGIVEPNFFKITLSGMIGNSLTFACAATGGSTNTAGSTTLAGGTGFQGYIPAWVLDNM